MNQGLGSPRDSSSAPQHWQHQPGLPCSSHFPGLREGICQNIREFLSPWFLQHPGKSFQIPRILPTTGGEKICAQHTNTTWDCSGSQTGPLVNQLCEPGAQGCCHQTRIISPSCLLNLSLGVLDGAQCREPGGALVVL